LVTLFDGFLIITCVPVVIKDVTYKDVAHIESQNSLSFIRFTTLSKYLGNKLSVQFIN